MKKKYTLYQVDAFTDKLFGGNPAAVCLLDNWLDDETLQNIGLENNLSETAFVIPHENDFQIRWFTPKIEVELCGHATLAAGHVIFNHTEYEKDSINFYSPLSGLLRVEKNNDMLTLDFPTDKVAPASLPKSIKDSLNIEPQECYKGNTDYLLIFDNQEEVEKLTPDFKVMIDSGARGVIVSAKGNEVDFVSRFFAPLAGIDEDPVTGSAHTTLAPIWSKKLNKQKLTAIQLSERRGHLVCELLNDRVKISGKAITYMKGEIKI